MKTVATAHQHIVWLYEQVEKLQERVAKLEGLDAPPWEIKVGEVVIDDEGT